LIRSDSGAEQRHLAALRSFLINGINAIELNEFSSHRIEV
jgi:hypothetical protein